MQTNLQKLTEEARELSVFKGDTYQATPKEIECIKLDMKNEDHQKIINEITGLKTDKYDGSSQLADHYYQNASENKGICILSEDGKFHVSATPDVILGNTADNPTYLNIEAFEGNEPEGKKIKGEYVCSIPPLDKELYLTITDMNDHTRALLTQWVTDYESGNGQVEVFSRKGRLGAICMRVKAFKEHVLPYPDRIIYINKEQAMALGYELGSNGALVFNEQSISNPQATNFNADGAKTAEKTTPSNSPKR